MLERDLEEKVKKLVKKLNGVSFKLAFPGCTGAPDRLILLGGKVFFVELKRPGGKLSARQKRIIEIFKAHDINIHVAYSLEDVKNILGVD